MAMAYERNYLQGRGNGHAWINNIIQAFIQAFPNAAQIPNKMTILRRNKKQNRFYTVHNLNSKVSAQVYKTAVSIFSCTNTFVNTNIFHQFIPDPY